MKISYSAIQTYLHCPAQYAYKYRDGLRLIKPQAHFEVGSIVHAALEQILTAHWKGRPLPHSEEAVRVGCSRLRERRQMTIDSEEHAQIAVRALDYHVPRMGLDDWETLTWTDGRPAVELELEVPFADGVTLQAHIDWIARSKINGRVWIVDHKTSKHRLSSQPWVEFNLQTALYREAVHLAGFAESAGALLHEMCYHPPSDVQPLKRAGKDGRRFSTAKNQRTDWETYSNALVQHGENPMDYLDMRDILNDQCAKSPFRRWVPNVTSEDGHHVIMAIARQAVEGMQAIKYHGAPAQANRVSEWTCGKCDHRPWCDAVLLDRDPRSLLITVYEPDKDSPYANSERPEDDTALREYMHRSAALGVYDMHGWSPHE